MVGDILWNLVPWFARPDGEIAEEGTLGFAVHGFQAGEEFQEVRTGEVQRVLVRLVGGARGVVHEGRRRLFDMTPTM